MGAQEDYTTIAEMPASEVPAAYEKIHADSCYENGHGGYSGTFAEVADVTIAKIEADDEENANNIIFGVWDGDDYSEGIAEKWGDAIAIHMKTGGWFIGAICSS